MIRAIDSAMRARRERAYIIGSDRNIFLNINSVATNCVCGWGGGEVKSYKAIKVEQNGEISPFLIVLVDLLLNANR